MALYLFYKQRIMRCYGLQSAHPPSLFASSASWRNEAADIFVQFQFPANMKNRGSFCLVRFYGILRDLKGFCRGKGGSPEF